MRKNLLIGAVTNYVWDDIAPFFNSYMQAGFENCECVMFTGNMSEPTLEKMRACGVDVRPIPEELLSGCVNDYRWGIYADYLREYVADYDMVFTADVRDSIFQADVFRLYKNSGAFLGIALEDVLLTEPCNQNWLIQRYGNDVYESMKNNRVVCTGTVWGTVNEFMAFTSAMAEHINSKNYPYYRVCDQAVGNYIIYHDKMFADVIRPSTNDDGCVMTIGLNDPQDIHIDSAGNVLNGKGEIASIIHQYDRKPAVIDIVVRKYSAGMSLFAKISMKHYQDSIGRVMRFLSRVHKRGLVRSVREAIQRRIKR